MIDKAIQFVLTEVDIGDPETNQLTMAYTAYALSLTELDDERRAVLEKLVYYVYGMGVFKTMNKIPVIKNRDRTLYISIN